MQDMAAASIDGLKRGPVRLVEMSTTCKFSIDPQTLGDIQLTVLQDRFRDLVARIPVLRRFAEGQKLHEIRSIEDGALLLFPHTMYKSYPMSVLEQGRYDALTRWLGTMVAKDLSALDISSCDSIDGWIDLLDAKTDIRIRHSSGTTGKLSFIPTDIAESYTAAVGFRGYFQGFGDEPEAQVAGIGEIPFISLNYRRGAQGQVRVPNAVVQHLYGGDESKYFTLYPGRLSADMISIGGRLESAAAKGELGRLQLSPALLGRREEFIRQQRERPLWLAEFLERMSGLKGQKVVLLGVPSVFLDLAVHGMQKGYEGLFGPDSLFLVAGGAKGRSLPEDWRERIARFSGVAFPRIGYGGSEASSGLTRQCPRLNYHVPPHLIPYLLDPATGTPLPRSGRHTGRYGFIDITTETRWGGFLTGDEVTLNFGDRTPCPCGRRGAYMEGEIRRLSEGQGGDDKISCAGSPAAYDKALEFISSGLD